MPRLKNKDYGFFINVADGHALTRSVEYEQVEGSAPEDVNPLAGLKVDELKAYAEEHDIDLGDATKKADIIAAIEEAEAERAEDDETAASNNE